MTGVTGLERSTRSKRSKVTGKVALQWGKMLSAVSRYLDVFHGK